MMDLLALAIAFVLGLIVGNVIVHHLMIRKYHRDRQWVLDWLQRWERRIFP
jgi:uncharacterized membrane-anchored protein YhcB (DUF1043 family)